MTRMHTDQMQEGNAGPARPRAGLISSISNPYRSVFICGLIGSFLSACASAPPRTDPIAGTVSMGVLVGAEKPIAQSTTSGIQSVEPWSYNGREGRLVHTPHYRLFTTQADTVLNARVPQFLEAALAAYRTSITGEQSPLPEPSLKLDTYILRSREDWAVLTRQMTGDQADLFLSIPRGGFAFGGKALLFDIGARDTPAIAAHEGWHQYTQRAFARPLPVWLEEGLATYMEGHRFDGRGQPQFLPWANAERFDQLRRAHAQGRLTRLPALLEAAPQNLLAPGTDDAALVYYAQVWALAHFLCEGSGGRYRSGLCAVLKDAAVGSIDAQLARTFGAPDAARLLRSRRGPGVFEAYFGDLLQAASEYDAFIEALVQPGSRSAVVAGESPFARAMNSAPGRENTR